MDGVFGTGGRLGVRVDAVVVGLAEGDEATRVDSPTILPAVAVEIPAGGVGGSGDTESAVTDAEWA